MRLFDSLRMRKENGEKLNLEELSARKLKQMFFDEGVFNRLQQNSMR